MKRVSILQKLENAGVIAVVRGKTKEEALKASQAIVAGGMRGIELTFTVPHWCGDSFGCYDCSFSYCSRG